jgi:LPXTG-motif cell wall-anchored protein
MSMRGKTSSVFGLLLVAFMVLVLAAVPAYAASPAQGGMNNWYTLAPGQSQEWIFHYTGNDDKATIELASDPANSVGFRVYTNQQWSSLASDSTIVPVGQGTQTTSKDDNGNITTLNNGDLFWVAGSRNGDTYHVQVYSRSGQAVRYWINATGAGNGGLAPFNQNNQVQLAQTQTNPGAQTTQSAQATQGTQPNQTGTSGALAQGQTTTTPGQTGPRTLPVTGGESNALIWLFGIGLVLISAGWMARRRAL